MMLMFIFCLQWMGLALVHRDFRPGNLMIYDGKLEGIIDWSSGRAGFAEEDFCSLEHGEWTLDPDQKASFLAGYATIRPVPNYATIMPLLRLSKAIASIGFTVRWALGKVVTLIFINSTGVFSQSSSPKPTFIY